MKVAISAQDAAMNALVDLHFGRCTYFAIYDTQTQKTEFVANDFRETVEGAGQSAAEFIAALGVEKAISCEFGVKAKTVLDANKIQLIILPQHKQTIKQITKLLQNTVAQ